jgi:hypothetical protein
MMEYWNNGKEKEIEEWNEREFFRVSIFWLSLGLPNIPTFHCSIIPVFDRRRTEWPD